VNAENREAGPTIIIGIDMTVKIRSGGVSQLKSTTDR
jgi:hypothetical protein